MSPAVAFSPDGSALVSAGSLDGVEWTCGYGPWIRQRNSMLPATPTTSAGGPSRPTALTPCPAALDRTLLLCRCPDLAGPADPRGRSP